MTLLLTGATGFVGMELLARLVKAPAASAEPVWALIRADDDAHATRRLHETLLSVFGAVEPYAGRVTAIAGDLERPGLGIDPMLAETVSEIIHGAASVSFELALDRSRAINLEGTRRVLMFARRCPRLRRLTYISTAYVAGRHRGVFGEDDLDVGQRFRNPYERSKFEAEGLVRASAAAGLPVTIVRPSIVVGDRHSGWTASFNVLYWPLRSLAKGAYPILPARRGAPVDVVSVDYVADAICALHRMPAAEGGTFHSRRRSTPAASASCSTLPSSASAAGARRSSPRSCTGARCIRSPPGSARRAAGASCARRRPTCRTSRWACATTTPTRERRSARPSRPRRFTPTSTASSTTRCSRAGALDRSAGPVRWMRFHCGTAVPRRWLGLGPGGPVEYLPGEVTRELRPWCGPEVHAHLRLHRAEGLPREGQREDRRQERDADDDAGDRARQVVADHGHALQEHDASPEVQGRVADDHRRDLVLLAVLVDADAQGQAPEEGGEEGRAVSSR